MSATGATAEQRQHAIDLAQQIGAAAAAKQLGLNGNTVRSWLRRAGHASAPTPALVAAAQAKAATVADRKAQLASRLLDDAEQLRRQLFAPVVERHVVTLKGDGRYAASAARIVDVELNRPKPSDQRQMAVALAILVDKVQVLTGEATERIEQLSGELPAAQRRERALAVVTDLAERRHA